MEEGIAQPLVITEEGTGYSQNVGAMKGSPHQRAAVPDARSKGNITNYKNVNFNHSILTYYSSSPKEFHRIE